MAGKCPRCKGDCIELGELYLPVGKTRKEPVSVALCGKCSLVFYERIEKKEPMK